jgi:hypothetical protein
MMTEQILDQMTVAGETILSPVEDLACRLAVLARTGVLYDVGSGELWSGFRPTCENVLAALRAEGIDNDAIVTMRRLKARGY